MTVLESRPYTLPAAELGPENPLPMFRGDSDDALVGVGDSVPEEDRRYLGWRTAWRVLPYRMQDGYTRSKSLTALDSLVLENAFLRATFLPQYGGRLVSLLHKETERELLARNPVFQPANLALRDAWFSGGIEWNAGQPGHHYRTCDPVFAAEIEGPDGAPCLRLYEWDRVKGFFWHTDFWLPHGSPFLYARTRLFNPHPFEIPMYWWTNIAVEEREDIRVVVPAETALCNPYFAGLQVVTLPVVQDYDMTYSTRVPHAADFFARIPEGQRPWIAALDADGCGFFEVSTERLRGRKLFCWGNGRGGRRWQEFLAAPGHAYLEIQAGLARTQMECLPMPPGAEWTFTEAFGYLEMNKEAVHSRHWTRAWKVVDAAIKAALPPEVLHDRDRGLAEMAGRRADRILRMGTGWGALEHMRQRQTGDQRPWAEELVFPEASLGPEQEPWLELLMNGMLPKRAPGDGPGSLMTQPEWQTLLEHSLSRPGGAHWLSLWHLGNMLMEARDFAGAQVAWEESLRLQPTSWAFRNLAVIAQRQRQMDEACRLYQLAWEAGPRVAPIAAEYVRTLREAERPEDVLSFVESLPQEIRQHERVQLGWARAAIETGHLDGVEPLFHREFATIREGEVTLSDLWFAYHETRLARELGTPVPAELRTRLRREMPPPPHLDFRMAIPDESAD